MNLAIAVVIAGGILYVIADAIVWSARKGRK